MRTLDSREHRTRVNEFFYEKMKSSLAQLDVHSVKDDAIRKVDRSIRDTGSELPRAILGYQIAFLHTLKQFGSAAYAPLVIDSPNQQDQDRRHLERILRFIRDGRPSGTQLVLGLVDSAKQDFGGREIVLDRKYSLLLEDEYKKVGDEVRQYVDAALK